MKEVHAYRILSGEYVVLQNNCPQGLNMFIDEVADCAVAKLNRSINTSWYWAVPIFEGK